MTRDDLERFEKIHVEALTLIDRAKARLEASGADINEVRQLEESARRWIADIESALKEIDDGVTRQ